ncbi:MAG: hypothetical protein IJZ54_07485 [Clostridia bacterium]|nr:hypothetical protein [Clostridia bacterium]
MKKKMKEFFAKLPQSIMLIFGIMMIVFTSVAFINGFETVSVYRIFQLLGIAVIAGALMLVAFSDIFIKKMNQILRAVIFMIPLMITTLVFALAFSWFSTGNIKSWAIFITIFLVCFAGCFVIFLIINFIEKLIRGKKYTEKLKEYQNKKNTD